MNSFFLNFTNFAVILHLAMGCSWHHGLGGHAACVDQLGNSVCGHATEFLHQIEVAHLDNCQHRHCSHALANPATGSSADSIDGLEFVIKRAGQHSHFGCCDDECATQLLSKFEIQQVETQSLCFCEFDRLKLSYKQNFFSLTQHKLPCECNTLAGLRAHLVFGVLII